MPKKKGQFVFVLQDVNLSQIDEKYQLSKTGLEAEGRDPPSNTTRISELNTSEKGCPETIPFLDEAKRLHSCFASMIDHNTNMEAGSLPYYCFWCRHSFNTRGIGCPIRYVPCQAVKNYHSEISRDLYTIHENITTERKDVIDDPRVTVVGSEHYVTDGIFCSFNCCQAWILDNKHSRTYDQSTMLLAKMYNQIMNTKAVVINAAPHWRLLQKYGGHLDIDLYRDGFSKIDYENHGMHLPTLRSVTTFFEEKMRF